MSKVSDDLKRIRDAQQSAARPVEAPPYRPSMPAPAPAPAPGMGLMPIAFAVVAFVGLVSLILVWQLQQKQSAPIATIKPAPAPTQVASIAPSTPAPTPVATPKPSASAPAAAPVATAAAPPAPVIKLQGILYSGLKSSAMISGQTVVSGDEVGGYRVAAIGQRSVTLVSATKTNVLTLGR